MGSAVAFSLGYAQMAEHAREMLDQLVDGLLELIG